MEHLFEAIKKIAEENSDTGFTVDLTTLKKVTGGISVAYLETQNSFGDEGLKRVLKHALEHEKKIGGWLDDDDGSFYFDSVRIFTDLEDAKRFGRENKQIAIFDLTNLRLIKL
jgi:fructokinase